MAKPGKVPKALSSWAPEKAWWLGVTLGDGYSDNRKGRRRMTLVSGDRDQVEKWAVLLGRDTSVVKLRPGGGTFAAEIGCGALTEQLSRYGMDGRKGDRVRWPQDLPEALLWDFVRGLWDSDGSVLVTPAKGGRRPLLRCVFCNKSEALVDALVARVSCLRKERQRVNRGEYAGRVYYLASVRGAAAVEFVREVYSSAPEALRCDRKYEEAAAYLEWWDANQTVCDVCGRVLVGRTRCRWCARVQWTEQHVCSECADTEKTVYAKGMCQTCYCRERRREQKSWTRDSAFQKRLSAFPVGEWPSWSDEKQKKELRSLVQGFKAKGLPWFTVDYEEEDSLERVCRGKITVEEDEIVSVGWSGQRVCLAEHRHRLKASHRTSVSPERAFRDEKFLRRAIEYQLQYGSPITPQRVLQAVKAITKCPLNFPPVLARWLVEKYAPEGGAVLDPCAGYGGRLLGTAAAGRSYIGYDIEPRTVKANTRLAERVGVESVVRSELREVEDAEAWPEADLLLTCPPYFDRERYGDRAAAALRRYRSSYDRWVEGFLGALFGKAAAAVPRVVFVTASVGLRDGIRDLPGDVREQAKGAGFALEEEWRWRLASFGAGQRHETVSVFRRS